MPTKHTRRSQNGGDFNLAPDTSAQPLAAYTKSTSKEDAKKLAPKRGTRKAAPKAAVIAKPKRKKEIVEGYGLDDTPRAFARLMNRQTNKRHISGLDDGEDRTAKKAKTSKPAKVSETSDAPEMPKIKPGERMSDYNARVDQAIKISGLIQKGKAVDGIKERRTKKEKQMHKLYDQWREEEKKIQEAKEEAREKQEEQDEENEQKYGESIKVPELSRKHKRSRVIGESNDKEGDIWASLKEKRGQKAKLSDVVQAPPELVKPKEKFKMARGAKVNVANVPVASGSLKKREELSDARTEVIERYRAMMRAAKGGEGL
ncbi:hypothetical protein Q7P37_001579 [Cladosporium fusiforme]